MVINTKRKLQFFLTNDHIIFQRFIFLPYYNINKMEK